MQPAKTPLIAAGMIALAILGHGLLTRYAATGDQGQAVWRIDTFTGKVSTCGSALNGGSLAQASGSLGEQLKQVAGNASAMAQYQHDMANYTLVSTPRCSPWSEP